MAKAKTKAGESSAAGIKQDAQDVQHMQMQN